MNTNKTKKGQLKHHGNPVMGGSGAFGLLGGANIVSAGKQILKSGIGRGAINLVKSIFKKKAPKNIGGFREFANPKLRDHFNKVPKSKPPVVNQSRNLKQQWPSSKFKSGIGARGPLPTFPKSKPVDFKGPNPAHNIGAGGNSYPK